jgi:hypothetical protein
MQISPPYGFKRIIPLQKSHRVALSQYEVLAVQFRRMNVVPVTVSEFGASSHDYPIVFLTDNEGESFGAMAVVGVAANQNLFVTPENTWEPDAYFPAYIRRYPFCMTLLKINGNDAPERIACVERAALSERGDALFDEQGEPLPDWAERQSLLFEYEHDLARTGELCHLLTQHGLLESFVMQAIRKGSETVRMTKLYRVAEAKLSELPLEVITEFTQKGMMACIYAHLLSLSNFQRLVMRQARSAAS